MDKRRLTTALAVHLVNPVTRAAVERGLSPPSYAILETTGRRTGRPRRTPVGNGLDGDTFWLVAEHGRRAGYVRNIEADPRVRVKAGGRWREGVARLMPEDDPRERQRRIGRRFNAAVVRAMGTELLTVRIDLSPDERGDERPRRRRSLRRRRDRRSAATAAGCGCAETAGPRLPGRAPRSPGR